MSSLACLLRKRMQTLDSKRTRAIFCVVAGLQLISWGTGFYVFGLTLVPIENDLGLSRSSAALAFPLALLFEGLCSVLVGTWIARRLGAYVLAGGALLTGVGLLVLSQANSLLQFNAAWVLIGASFACTLYTPLFSLIATEFPSTYRRKVTVISLVTGFSSTLFLPIGGWLIAEVGWRDCLLIYAALNIFLCAPGYLVALSAIRPAILPPTATISGPAIEPSTRTDVAHRRLKIYTCLAVFTSAIGALSATVSAHLIPMLMERGLAAHTALLAPAAIGALQTFSRVPMLFGSMERRIHHFNFGMILLFPVAILTLYFSGMSVGLLACFVVLYGVAHGGWTIVRATAVPQYLGTQGAAVSNGTIALWATVGRIALPALVAFLWTPSLGYSYGYWALLLVSALGFIAYALAQKTYFGDKPYS